MYQLILKCQIAMGTICPSTTGVMLTMMMVMVVVVMIIHDICHFFSTDNMSVASATNIRYSYEDVVDTG